jgi:hypothetical protein
MLTPFQNTMKPAKVPGIAPPARTAADAPIAPKTAAHAVFVSKPIHLFIHLSK